MATTHERQCQILINVAYSLQYSLKDQIKPKHLASRFYFYFFYFIMLQSILHTHFTSSNHYIFLISSEFFFLYVVLQNWLPCVAFERRWTILTTTYI